MPFGSLPGFHAAHAVSNLRNQPTLQVMCGNVGIPTATVVMKGPDGIARRAAAIGTGPVDAAYKVRACCAAAAAGRRSRC